MKQGQKTEAGARGGPRAVEHPTQHPGGRRACKLTWLNFQECSRTSTAKPWEECHGKLGFVKWHDSKGSKKSQPRVWEANTELLAENCMFSAGRGWG